MPPTYWQSGSALQEFLCPLPPSGVAVHSTSSYAHCPQAVRHCIARLHMPSAPKPCGSALQAFHCSLTPAAKLCIAAVPLPAAPM